MHLPTIPIVRRSTLVVLLFAAVLMCAAPAHAQQPAEASADVESYRDIPTETLFKRLQSAFPSASTEIRKDALVVRLTREDVFLIVDGNEVPPAAGIEHAFYFFRCPCGTMVTHGSFLLHDYEVNDVIDTLRENPKIKIIGTSAFLLGEHPRLVLLRFQGEGHDDELAGSLNAAFRWIGEARSQPKRGE